MPPTRVLQAVADRLAGFPLNGTNSTTVKGPWGGLLHTLERAASADDAAASLEKHLIVFHYSPEDRDFFRRALADFTPGAKADDDTWTIHTPHTPLPRLDPDWLLSPTLINMVREVQRVTPWPVEFIASPLLAVCASCIGNSRQLRINDLWMERPCLWIAMLGEAGSYKTPALTFGTKPLYAMQAAWFDTWKEESTHYQDDLANWESQSRQKRGAKPLPVKQRKALVSDVTLEKLVDVLEENPRGVLLERDELLGWLLSMNQYKKNGGQDRQIWLSIWSGKDFPVDRKSDNYSAFMRDPFVGIVGGMQPSRFRELRQGAEDGLVDRFLYFWPEATPKKTEEIHFPTGIRSAYTDLISNLLALEGTVSEFNRTVPLCIRLEDDAFALFSDREWAVRRAAQNMELPQGLRTAYQKMGSHAARLALTLHIVQVADKMAVKPMAVNAATVDAAWKITECSMAHLRRAFDDMDSTGADERAGRAVEWIKRHGGTATVRDLLSGRAVGIKKASEARQVIEDLADRHLGTMTTETAGNREQIRITLPVEE